MTKFYHIFTFTLIIFTANWSVGQESNILFYNIENLFDTIDTPDKNDADFLPQGRNNWNSDRYNEKLEHVNEVFKQFESLLLIGLCEIENKQVVEDLVSHGDLKNSHAIVHVESLDKRGIDNAIIYDSTILELVEQGVVRFQMPEGSSPSRDILWAKFHHRGEDIFAMVNHWPSRRGGQQKSEPKRMLAAHAAENFIDSLMKHDKKAQIIFMGDLNDYPENSAPSLISKSLNPMITKESGEYGGSHSYRGEWGVLDHIMVSPNSLKRKKFYVHEDSGSIQSFEFLMTTYKGNIVPFRTYGGGKYLKGYSDHLPVSIKISL